MIKKYCDTSNLKEIKECITKYKINGITTNPSIMRKDGVKNYKAHCKKILKISKNLPVSFEVFGDSIQEIKRQALIINSFGIELYKLALILTTYQPRPQIHHHGTPKQNPTHTQTNTQTNVQKSTKEGPRFNKHTEQNPTNKQTYNNQK